MLFDANTVKTEEDVIKYLDHFYSFQGAMRYVDAYSELPLDFQNNKNITSHFLSKGMAGCYDYIPEHFKEDYDFHLDLIKRDCFLLQRIPEKYQKDRNLVCEAVSINGDSLRCVLRVPDTNYANDREIALKAVKSNGKALTYLSTALKNDLEIVNFAIHNNVRAIAFIGDDIKKNSEELFLIDPFNFLKWSFVYGNSSNFVRIKEDLKHHDFPETALKVADIFSNSNHWMEYLKAMDEVMDLSSALRVPSVIDESFYYLSIFMPHWQRESVEKLKHFSKDIQTNENIKIHKIDIFNRIELFLDKELHRRDLKEKVSDISQKNVSKSKKKRKLGIH
jgi:hypothetical protein